MIGKNPMKHDCQRKKVSAVFKDGRYYSCRLGAQKRVCKDKKIGEYHVLYVKGNTLLLPDVFEIFWNTCLKIYDPVLARSFTAPELDWKVA